MDHSLFTHRTAIAGMTLPNTASVGLHSAMGFKEVGTYRRIGWKAGAWHDVQWWQLDLRPGEPGSPNQLTKITSGTHLDPSRPLQ